jgi:hypothetical protein
MKKNIFFVVMLAKALVFGLVFTSCETMSDFLFGSGGGGSSSSSSSSGGSSSRTRVVDPLCNGTGIATNFPGETGQKPCYQCGGDGYLDPGDPGY